jgi:hypothetical protein
MAGAAARRRLSFGSFVGGLGIGVLAGLLLLGLVLMNMWWCFEEGGFHLASKSFICADGCNECSCGGVSTLKSCGPRPKPWWKWW